MALPVITRPTEDVHGVTVRGLSRGEVMELRDLANEENVTDFEVRLLALATQTPLEEMQKWYADAPSGIVGDLVNKAVELSGLDPNSGNE